MSSMFICVFKESDCDAMLQAGFEFLYEANSGSAGSAWVFLPTAGKEIPDGTEYLETATLLFREEEDESR